MFCLPLSSAVYFSLTLSLPTPSQCTNVSSPALLNIYNRYDDISFSLFLPCFSFFCNTPECSICPVKVFAYVCLCVLIVNKWENKGGRSCHFWCAPGGTEILGGQETSRQPYSPPPPFHPKPRPPLLGSRRRLISALLPFSPIHYIVIAENLVLGKLPLVNKSPVLLPNLLHHAAHPSSER